MKTLMEMLVREQERLEEILKKARDGLQQAPDGSLRLSSRRKAMQFYRRLPEAEKRDSYVPRAQEALLRKLAQKAYDEKIVKAAEKSLYRVRMLIKEYETDQIEQVYLKLHPERRKLIEPVEKTWDERLEAWLSEEYQGKPFQEGTVMIRTEKGERVRSKSEKILADYFYRNGIPYKYERPLYLKGLGVVHPDFTILSRKSRQEIFWEHNGRMDDPVYAQNAVRKIQAYMENDIYPGENLVLTFETEKTVLDDRMVKGIVERFL